MARKSIRLRLLAWFGFFLAALVAGFGAIAFELQKRAAFGEVDSVLALRVDAASRAFRGSDPHPPPPPEFAADRHRGPRPDFRRPHFERTSVQLPDDVLRQFGSNEYFAVWGLRENRLLVQSGPNVAAIPRPTDSPTATLLRYRTRGAVREAYQFTERGDCILVGGDLGATQARLRLFAGQLVVAGLSVLLLGLGGGALASRLLFTSIQRIGATARRIAAGNLAERIPAADMDRELGELADVLNSTFARLDAAFARQQQFTADAAHELRTPLAVILSETQTALRRDRAPEEYRDSIRACEEAAQHMRRLSEALLALARLDAGNAPGKREPVDLALVARECLDRLQATADQRGIRLQTDLRPATLPGHADQLGRVFANLLENALDHTPAGGTVRATTAAENDQVVAVVADTGAGIPPESLPHVFERFYQVAQSRSEREGHFGIGLALCKAIVEAHGGRIEAASELDAGTTMTLRWPAAPAEKFLRST
jgi:heavy metal sensor kinase